MPCNISLNQPLLEQQSVQEMLNFSSEEANLRVSLEDWIKIAVKLIKAELADCDCDEEELLSFRLECMAPHPTQLDAKEVHAMEWKPSQLQAFQAGTTETEEELHRDTIEAEPEEDFNQTLPVSPDFLRHLAQRLDEGIFTTFPNLTIGTRASWDFRVLSQNRQPGEIYSCDGKCKTGNDTSFTVYKDGKKVRCEGFCGSTSERRRD